MHVEKIRNAKFSLLKFCLNLCLIEAPALVNLHCMDEVGSVVAKLRSTGTNKL